MRSLLIILVFLPLLSAIPAINGQIMKGTASNYSVEIASDMGQPVEGIDHVEVSLKDKASRPVPGIQVKKTTLCRPYGVDHQ